MKKADRIAIISNANKRISDSLRSLQVQKPSNINYSMLEISIGKIIDQIGADQQLKQLIDNYLLYAYFVGINDGMQIESDRQKRLEEIRSYQGGNENA